MEYIVGYYTFTLQQYIIHKLQHSIKWYKTHKLHHHNNWNRNDITIRIKKSPLYQGLDLYFYGNIFCFYINFLIFDRNIIIFQIFLAYLSFYFHDEYHNPNSILKNYSIYKYLKNKHQIHHQFPTKNHFLIEPTFDIIFNTYQ